MATKTMPRGKEKNLVLEIVESEGFDYTFQCYSEFEDVADKEFHKLRKLYLKAQEDLAKYIGFK